ncbi:MAG: hypothetical protein ACREJX_01045 [Polyangiaceae bacterium]
MALACIVPFVACFNFDALENTSSDGGIDAAGDGNSDADASSDCGSTRTACAGACVDLATDGHNCGRCGHDCLGGGCNASMCVPVTIADHQDSPFGIAVDAQHVYWANNDVDASFASCPLAGCGDAGTTVLLDQQYLPADVFVAGGHLFMTTYGTYVDGTKGTALACDPNDCASTLIKLSITETPSGPVAIVADTSTAYWTDNAGGLVRSCPSTGCATPTTIATDVARGPWYGLALAAGSVFWTSGPPGDGGAVYSCAQSGCASPTLISESGGSPFDLAVDGTSVYWTTGAGGQVLRCPLAGCGANAPVVIADNQGMPAGIAVDSSGIYWVNQTAGTVVRCDVSGCGGSGPTILTAGSMSPWEIVLDAASIYWTDPGADGRVLRLAKP